VFSEKEIKVVTKVLHREMVMEQKIYQNVSEEKTGLRYL